MMTKVAIVTGGSGGIGEAIVLGFAAQGYKVAIGCFRGMVDADLLAIRAVEAGSPDCFAMRADVAIYDQAAFLIDEALDRFSAIDVLVNCAGIHKDSTVARMEAYHWERVLAVNLTGAFNCIKAAVPEMCEGGRIINISSVAGQVGVYGAANYAASKAGLVGLTKSVAREVARAGITANAVALGYFDVGMGEGLPPDIKARIVGQIPMRRFGRVEEAVAAVLFLVSEGAGYITGQVINVNGGYYV